MYVYITYLANFLGPFVFVFYISESFIHIHMHVPWPRTLLHKIQYKFIYLPFQILRIQPTSLGRVKWKFFSEFLK